MKKLLLCLTLLNTLAFAKAQSTDGFFDFGGFPDLTDGIDIVIDTASNPNNIWQLGAPQKAVFDSAHSPEYVIITDTINTYPVNDTSIFLLRQLASMGWTMPHTAGLIGYYNVDSDSLKDFGLIEISVDNGMSWIDILSDTLHDFFNSIMLPAPASKPVLTGSSNGWKYFGINFQNLAYSSNLSTGDTILLRFTFISDSIDNGRDGLMFDDFYLYDFAEGVNGVEQRKTTSTAFPNPSSHILSIDINGAKYKSLTLSVFNSEGALIKSGLFKNNQPISLDTHDLPPGNYYYQLNSQSDHIYSTGKFIVTP